MPMDLLQLLFLILSMFGGQQPGHKPSDKIQKEELSAYLAKEFDCEADQPVYFWVLEPYDFLGKGFDQAVVVASTCMTGTAGPDVHAVFTREENGELKELKIVQGNPEHRVLFGNPNWTLRIENGLLVEKYHDTSDREDPLVIRYKWDAAKEQFTAVSVAAAKPYPTSYDCVKAEAARDETSQAICYVKPLADLDIELAKTYKAYLEALAPAERKKAIEEQRAWLAKRNRDCVIYKWWVECLTKEYNERIAELRQRIAAKDNAKASARP